MSHLEWFWRRSHGTETDVVTQTNLPTATNNKRKKKEKKWKRDRKLQSKLNEKE